MLPNAKYKLLRTSKVSLGPCKLDLTETSFPAEGMAEQQTAELARPRHEPIDRRPKTALGLNFEVAPGADPLLRRESENTSPLLWSFVDFRAGNSLSTDLSQPSNHPEVSTILPCLCDSAMLVHTQPSP